MMKTCEIIKRELSSARGEVSEETAKHLQQCRECLEFRDDMLSLHSLRKKAPVEIPVGLKSSLLASNKVAGTKRSAFAMGLTATAALLTAILLVFTYSTNPTTKNNHAVEKLDLVAGFNELERLAAPVSVDEESDLNVLQPAATFFVGNASGEESLPEIYSAIDEYLVTNITPDIAGGGESFINSNKE